MYEEERFLVDEKWIKSVNNYNISLGGNGGLIGENHPLYGKSLSEETKRKLSESKKGENHPLYGIKGIDNPNYGRTHTKEARIKMSEKLKGEKNYWYGKETPMKGKTHTEKTKQKISEKLSGENHPLFKNKKSGLPLNILHTKNEKKPYYVKVKGKYLGAYSTIEEAIIVRDNYINKK